MRIPCGLCGSLCTLRASSFVPVYRSRNRWQRSARYATLNMGGWLDLTKYQSLDFSHQGLSPWKKRQASLAALTPKSLDAISEQETWVIIKTVTYHILSKTYKSVALIAVKCIWLLARGIRRFLLATLVLVVFFIAFFKCSCCNRAFYFIRWI